jgi:hypothetical protein
VDPIVLVAVLGAASGSPVLLSVLNSRAQRKANLQEYKRQDQIADRLEKRQDAQAEKVEKAAALLVVSNREVADAAKAASDVTIARLDVIHTLVNSQMTAAIQSELDATEANVVLMREIIGLNSVAGRNPTEASMDAVKATEVRIRELRVTLAERHRQDEIAQAQAQAISDH